MKIGWYYSDVSLGHRNKPGHPESEQRLVAIQKTIAASSSLQEILVPQAVREATDQELCLAHDPRYVAGVVQLCSKSEREGQLASFDEDTSGSPGSKRAARTNAGAHLEAVDAVLKGMFLRCFIAGRPPGHHARPGRAKGFCLFNNIAIAAFYALSKGCKCILIIDWDAHHGDGTQVFFWDNALVVLISIQQRTQLDSVKTMWPHSGDVTEDGNGEGKGTTINIPLTGGAGDVDYVDAFERIVVPVAFGLSPKPDLILVSAGYDAHQRDPVCQQRVSTGGFTTLAAKAHVLAYMLGVPMIGTLEGGYNPEALAESAAATLQVWGTDPSDKLAMADVVPLRSEFTQSHNPELVRSDIDRATRHHAQYHKALRLHAS